MIKVKLFKSYSLHLFCLLIWCISLPVLSEEQVTQAESIHYFDIWEFNVEGNSLIEDSEIESILYPHLGEHKNLQVVEDARDALQQLYKIKGYPAVVVSIPQQNVIGGVVTLSVTEGKIDRLRISGNNYFSRSIIREEVPSLSKGNSLYMELVRKELDELNRSNPYRSVTPVLRPGREQGTLEVELKVKDRLPLNAMIETNNRYTSNTSHSRLMASIGYDNLWQRHHGISFSYQTSPEQRDEVDVVGFTYVLPTSRSSRLAVYGVDSNSQVAAAEDLNVVGVGRVLGMRSIHTLLSGNNYAHSLSLGFDYKDFDETQELLGSDEFNVPIDYVGFNVSYNGNIRQQQHLTQFSMTSNFGVRGLGNDQEEFEYKRFLARPNYFYVQGGFSQDYSLTESLGLFYRLKGQYSESPLISNEQFGAGGMDSVRGYMESTALGDNGWLGTIQLNYDTARKQFSASIQKLGLSIFVDAARLSVIDALPQQTSQYKLLGAGVGVDMRAFRKMDMKLYYATPLYKLEQDNFEDESRVHFSLAYRFN